MSADQSKSNSEPKPVAEVVEFPEPSHRQTLKVMGSILFLMVIQVPVAMRQIFRIRRHRVDSETIKYWYLFVASNLPITAYFMNNARKEIKANRKLEQDYLLMMQRTGQHEMSGFEAAMLAMEQPENKRKVVDTNKL